MKTRIYSFADGDRLESRNTYFYTPYGGMEFLDAWWRQRKEALVDLPQPASPEVAAGGLPQSGQVNTKALLDGVLSALSRDEAETPAIRGWLGHLVKKFEVTKRIHSGYDAQFRALDRAAYRGLDLYPRLAGVFEAAYGVTQDLVYLNALLKCVDTLCSVQDLLGEDGRARLAWLIGREGAHIEALTEKVARR